MTADDDIRDHYGLPPRAPACEPPADGGLMTDTRDAIAALAIDSYQQGATDALLSLAETFEEHGLAEAARFTRSAVSVVQRPSLRRCT